MKCPVQKGQSSLRGTSKLQRVKRFNRHLKAPDQWRNKNAVIEQMARVPLTNPACDHWVYNLKTHILFLELKP